MASVDVNEQSALFNEAVRKLATNLDEVGRSNSTNEYRDKNSYNVPGDKFDFQCRLWRQFKFDKQAILNCI